MTHYDLGSTAAASQNTGITTGHVVHTNHYNATRAIGSGAAYRYTGTTTLAKAGNWPNADGFFYDADGKQFEVVGEADITAFGAIPSADSTTAIKAAIASTAKNIYVPEGTFQYSSLITISRTLRLYGPGTLSETTLLDVGILVDTANDVDIDGLTFVGVEDLTAWNAGDAAYRQAYKHFVKFSNCLNGKARNIRSSGKRGTILFDTCQKMRADNIRHNGFLGDITTPATDANYYSVVRSSAGRDNVMVDIEGYSMGQVVLIDMDSSYNEVTHVTGRESHDNFVYCSSGSNCVFSAGVMENAVGSGLKVRGQGHQVSDNVVKSATAIGIALTGNGVAPDAFNANGFGTICTNNTLINCDGYAIQVASQDGLLPRDFTVANNIIENHIGTGGFAAIQINGERGMKVTGNIIRGSTATYAMEIAGVAGNRLFDCDISDNIISSASGEAIRISNVDNSKICGNVMGTITTTQAIEMRLCDDNFVTGNTINGSNTIRLATTGLGCNNNIVVNNKMTGAIDADKTVNITAPTLEYKYDNWTPTYTTTGTDFTSVTYGASVQGRYTIIENMVFISGYIDTNGITVGAATGSVVIGGLPAVSSNDGTGIRSAISISSVSNFTSNTPMSAYINRNSDKISLFYRTAIGGDESALAVADLNTAAGTKNVIVIGGHYWIN